MSCLQEASTDTSIITHLIFVLFIIIIIIAVSRTSLSSFATSFRSPKMFSRSFTMPLICRLTRTLLTPPSASALPDILGTRTGPGPGHPNLCCAASPLMAITHVNVRMFSYRDAEESRAARPGEHAHAQSAHKHWRKNKTYRIRKRQQNWMHIKSIWNPIAQTNTEQTKYFNLHILWSAKGSFESNWLFIWTIKNMVNPNPLPKEWQDIQTLSLLSMQVLLVRIFRACIIPLRELFKVLSCTQYEIIQISSRSYTFLNFWWSSSQVETF